MWALILSTIVTSAADSINPIGISQQFVLQGMVKKAEHIWYFIITIAVTNFLCGFFAYFGLMAPIGNFFGWILNEYGRIIFALEFILGIGCLIALCHSLSKNRMAGRKKNRSALQANGALDGDEKKVESTIKSVTPLSLTLFGIAATLSELTSAFPYYAFLAILFQYKLSVFSVIGILLIYNLIYSLPLIILYFVYIKARNRFDQFYAFVKTKMKQWAAVLGPVVFGAIGLFLTFHALSYLGAP